MQGSQRKRQDEPPQPGLSGLRRHSRYNERQGHNNFPDNLV